MYINVYVFHSLSVLFWFWDCTWTRFWTSSSVASCGLVYLLRERFESVLFGGFSIAASPGHQLFPFSTSHCYYLLTCKGRKRIALSVLGGVQWELIKSALEQTPPLERSDPTRCDDHSTQTQTTDSLQSRRIERSMIYPNSNAHAPLKKWTRHWKKI